MQSREDPRPSVVFVQPRTVKYRAGAVEDLLRALQTLPGITATSDFSSQLVIRGSTPDQNLILIDGFEVFNPYRLYGLVSMYNPETLADVQLSLGASPRATGIGSRLCWTLPYARGSANAHSTACFQQRL